MKNASITKFLSGVRSVFDMLPEHTAYKANFVENNKAKVYDFHAVANLNDSWIIVGKSQTNAFKKLTTNFEGYNVAYEPKC